MNQQQDVPVAYPAPGREYIPTSSPQSYPQAAPPQPVVAQYDEGHNNNYRVPYAAAPPPAGYPTNNTNYGPETSYSLPVQTNSKGEGFWKGCVAALCCCWVLDVCCC